MGHGSYRGSTQIIPPRYDDFGAIRSLPCQPMRNARGVLRYGLTELPLTLAGRRRLAGLPLALVALPLAALVLYLLYFGELYPLRPDTITHLDDMFRPFPGGDGAWGGPTLLGAWFVHAMAALGLQVVVLAVLRGLRSVSRRLTR
jgi:hypothetical protein